MKCVFKIILFIAAVFSTVLVEGQPWDLERCINYALEQNIAVQQASLQREQQQVNVDQNKWNLLPNLNAQGSIGYNFGQRIDPFTNQFATDRVASSNFFLASSVDLFNAFSKMNTLKQSKSNLAAAEFDLERIKNEISLRICLSYLTILLSKENVEIANQQVAITKERVDRMRKLVDAGAEPLGSLYDNESQLAQEELNLTNAQNSLNIARLELTQLLQLNPEQAQNFDIVTPELSDEGVELLTNSAQDIFLRAKQNMPEIMAAEQRLFAAEYGLAAARGRLYPSLSLSGSLGSGYSGANDIQTGEGTDLGLVPIGQVQGTNQIVTTLQPQTLFTEDDFETKSYGDQLSDNFNQNLQLNLTIPIFNGNAAKANVNRAKLNLQLTNLDYRDISNQLRFTIEQAYADAKAAMDSYMSSQKAVRALEESFKYAEVRYEQDVINAVDFNNIKTQLTNAQANLARAKYDFVFRTKILDFYLGNPITL